MGAHSLALIVNTILTILLIKIGASVHVVKLGSVAAFLIQPIFIKLYVDKHYKVDLKLELTEEPLKQKWNGLAQHVASVVQANAATVVLTVFSTLKNISVYSVYYLVAHGIRQVVVSLNTGIKALLGNMLAKNEMEMLDKTFSVVEFAFHTIVSTLFSIAGIMIVPFVKIYTANFTDAEYVRPVFAVLMVLGQAVYCLRIPYEMMMQAAGHYKQTQASSIIEAGINIVTAVVLVIVWGLEGVAISTIAAMGYRTIYLVYYMKKNVLKRSEMHFVKHLVVDALCVGIMIFACSWIDLGAMNYYRWACAAVLVTLICGSISAAVNAVFYGKELWGLFKAIQKRRTKS